jgi:hypothetical protein
MSLHAHSQLPTTHAPKMTPSTASTNPPTAIPLPTLSARPRTSLIFVHALTPRKIHSKAARTLKAIMMPSTPRIRNGEKEMREED